MRGLGIASASNSQIVLEGRSAACFESFSATMEFMMLSGSERGAVKTRQANTVKWLITGCFKREWQRAPMRSHSRSLDDHLLWQYSTVQTTVGHPLLRYRYVRTSYFVNHSQPPPLVISRPATSHLPPATSNQRPDTRLRPCRRYQSPFGLGQAQHSRSSAAVSGRETKGDIKIAPEIDRAGPPIRHTRVGRRMKFVRICRVPMKPRHRHSPRWRNE